MSYGSYCAVRSVSVRLASGDFIVCTGPSGGGKSTLALAISGALPKGAIRHGSVSISRPPVASIFQEPSSTLTPYRRIGDQVADVLAARRAPLSSSDLLAQVGIADLARSFPHQLSAGQIQRAAIARALAMDPGVLVADEPTASLDPETESEIIALVSRLRQTSGMPVVWITHRPDPVASLATSYWIMEDGRLTQADCLPQPAPPRRPTQPARGEAALTAAGIGVRYGKAVLEGVDISLRAGETCILRGRSGSGKSTLARVLAGIESPSSGSVRRDGEVQLVWPDAARALNPRWTACDAITEPLRIRGVPDGERAAECRKWLSLLGLPESCAARRTGEASGGQRRRMLIARALITGPRTVIFDEATAGLDRETKSRLIASLRSIQQESGAAFLWITHDGETVNELPGERYRLEGGRLLSDA